LSITKITSRSNWLAHPKDVALADVGINDPKTRETVTKHNIKDIESLRCVITFGEIVSFFMEFPSFCSIAVPVLLFN